MFCKAQITVIEEMSSTNQWCVPDAGQDEFAIDFDRSLSSLDVDINTPTASNISAAAAAFTVPDITSRKAEHSNNDSSQSEAEKSQMQCHAVSLVHGKKIKYSQLTDIDCTNNVKRFCFSKEMEQTENIQSMRCRQYGFPVSEQLRSNGSHFYSSGSMINTILSQVVQLPALPLSETIEQENSYPVPPAFQYIMLAPTSAAVKLQEEALTYLNQGQSYEIKVRRTRNLGDQRGKIYRSVIHMGFQERRLQYIEREQIAEWQLHRQGERIIEIDLPLTYGVIECSNSLQNVNECEFIWDSAKELGVFLKINCISTEFTPKKHGGEKGVPFRILIETFSHDDPCERLHAASCQVKVFKPKGADRKHKTEAEKLCQKPPSEREKFHPQFEVTVFKDLISVDPWSVHQTRTSSHSTIPTTPSSASSSPVSNHFSPRSSIYGMSQDPQTDDLNYQDDVPISCNDVHDCPDTQEPVSLTDGSSNIDTIHWLQQHMFGAFLKDFSHYTGADLMNLKRHDLIDICGLSDGIRLYNCLHPKRGSPSLTIYVRIFSQQAFQAIFLRSFKAVELEQKLKAVCNIPANSICELYLSGPLEIHIAITDEVIENLTENSVFLVETMRGHSGDPLKIVLKEYGRQYS